jgi:hypothetical protein
MAPVGLRLEGDCVQNCTSHGTLGHVIQTPEGVDA